MDQVCTNESIRTVGCENAKIAKLTAHVVDILAIAASPTFAFMALLSGALDAGMPNMLCSGMQQATPLSGMAVMYLLMSAFHSAPWLRLISSRLEGHTR